MRVDGASRASPAWLLPHMLEIFEVYPIVKTICNENDDRLLDVRTDIHRRWCLVSQGLMRT
jgi:hypothetical protein